MTVDPRRIPYAGLRSFEIPDSDRFYGRAKESSELRALTQDNRLVIVHGRSGVGKTSLIRAGLLPTLNRGAVQVLGVGRLPVPHPPHPAGIEAYNPFTLTLLSSWIAGTSLPIAPGLTLPQFFQRLPIRTGANGEVLPVVAVIDQFENVFADTPLRDLHREALLDQIVQAVQGVERLRLLISIREDDVDELLPYESQIPPRYRARYRVLPLDKDSAVAAVAGPLEATDRSFAPGVAEALVTDMRTTTVTNDRGEQRSLEAATVEPVNLQIVCRELWCALPDDVTTITQQHLEAHGDVEAILTSFCAATVSRVAAREHVSQQAIWDWLQETFVTDRGTRDNAYEGFTATGTMPNAVAWALHEQGILRAEKRAGAVRFELLDDQWIEPVRRGRRQTEHLDVDVDPAAPPEAVLRFARAAAADGMYRIAEEHAKRVVDASQHTPTVLAEAWELLGDLATEQGSVHVGDRAEDLYAAAEERYNRAAELFETAQSPRAVGRTLGSLGRLFLKRHRFADAVAALQGAIARLPDHIESHIDLAQALHNSGQPIAALGEYGTLLTIAPETVEALVGRGEINVARDPAAALHDLDKAIQLEPEIADRHDVISARTQASALLERRP